jgi:lipopolysaccharide biosynthesis glycosyltransferase
VEILSQNSNLIFNDQADSQEYNLVCTGIDDNYLWPWMVSIFSASIHSQKKIKVGLGVIKGNFSRKNLELARNFCNYLKIDLIYKEFEFDIQVQLEHLPKETYIRILWMDVLDEQFLWLDSDTLALPGWDEIFSYLGPGENEPIICAAEDKKINSKRK